MIKSPRPFVLLSASLAVAILGRAAEPLPSTTPPAASARLPLARTLDLNVGESASVELRDGNRVQVKLVSLHETRDPIRQAVRAARVEVQINGFTATLTSATYHLPVTVGGVQVDCPITRGYTPNSSKPNAWGLVKEARLRLWPASSPWLEPGTFRYPLRQRWFASDTQMANEPTFVDGGETPGPRSIYYHYGLDFGGAEGLEDVLAATDGLVVSAANETLAEHRDSPAKPRYDVVYLLDDRGWYYRYSHLKRIDVKPGETVRQGQTLGLLGKEGGSGGWAHLHFDITCRQPSGQWGIEDGYAYIWEAYQRQYAPRLIAVARPHHLAFIGEKVLLDGSRSWSRSGSLARFDWTFSDGSAAAGPTVEKTYARPGTYSEILKVTDSTGAIAYDFAVVQIIDREQAERLPPTIHAAFHPTLDLKAGAPIAFWVRTFRTRAGSEVWNFGDGTPAVTVRSDGNARALAPDGYAVTEHRFERPGDYLVKVERTNEHGYTATARLHVRVGE